MLIGILGCMAERLKQQLLEEEKAGGYSGRPRCLQKFTYINSAGRNRTESSERAP